METIFKVQLPLKRIPSSLHYRRWFDWLLSWGGGSVSEFGGSRTNTVRHLLILRWHVLTVHCNEYHDRSDEERAEEYLRKWSECEKECRGLRLIVLGDETGAEVKKVIRDSFGVDLDEGTIK